MNELRESRKNVREISLIFENYLGFTMTISVDFVPISHKSVLMLSIAPVFWNCKYIIHNIRYQVKVLFVLVVIWVHGPETNSV